MVDRRVKLTYPKELLDQPILHQLISKFGLITNIHRADVSYEGAWLVLDLRGEEGTIESALEWLSQLGIDVQEPTP